MASDAAREARRRRLVERGSDRLAFITGQSHSIAPSSPIDSPRLGQQESAALKETFISEEAILGARASETQKSRLLHSAHEQMMSKSEDSSTAFEVWPSEANQSSADGNSERNADNNQHTGVRSEEMPSRKVNSQSDQPVTAEKRHQLFSCSKISKAISASENIRLLTAVVMALLVVVGIIRHRPLVLLILADLSIVVGLLMKSRSTDRRNKGVGSTDSIGRLLEIGLLVQHAVGALVMDCSVCAVIMISLLRF